MRFRHPLHSGILRCFDRSRAFGLIQQAKQIFRVVQLRNQVDLFAILGAEYILRLLPKGTHDYEKFITPSELSQYARSAGLEVQGFKGMGYNPFTKFYSLNSDTSVNYLVATTRSL